MGPVQYVKGRLAFMKAELEISDAQAFYAGLSEEQRRGADQLLTLSLGLPAHGL
jgi:hypothetical protein